MTALRTVLEITKASLRVLDRHRRLMAFPALSIMALITLLVLVLPILIGQDPLAMGIALAVFYFAAELISNFLLAALTCESLRALRGQSTSVSGGLGAASTRLRAIACYSGISATVGVVLDWLCNGERGAGQLFRRLAVTAWVLLTYLALPVMMAERRGGYDSIVRSSRLLRQTWGETAIAELGLRVAWIQIVLITFALAALLAEIIDQPLALMIAMMILLAFAVVANTLQAIYRAALYIFAAEGVLPAEFDTPAMHDVWHVK
jgi:hypothetical protein